MKLTFFKFFIVFFHIYDNMKIIITEEQKKKLFIPRRLSKDDSRYSEHNNSQPDIDGVKVNQYDIDGRKQGVWVDFNSNGGINYKMIYHNDVLDPYREYYHNNGSILARGSYGAFGKYGYWEYFYDNGVLNSRGHYLDNKKSGYWEYFYDNGKPYMSGIYDSDEKVGKWDFYNVLGKLSKKDFISVDNGNTITEMDIKKKDFLGMGSFHKVYPLKYDETKVIKVPKSDISKDELDNPERDSWYNIFKKYPNFFPKIYKITNNYVIMEKLNTSRVKSDIQIMEDELVMLNSDIALKIEEEHYNITEILYEYIQRFVNGDNSYGLKLEEIIKKVKNKLIFKRYINLITSIVKLKLRGFIDVNDGNFGYDDKGKLKMLDI